MLRFLYLVLPSPLYLVLHNILENFTTAVSFSIAIIAWYGVKQRFKKQDLIICLAFLAFTMLNLAHTLSYIGMPHFLSPNSINKTSTYWILSILINGVGLFGAAQFSGNINKHTKSFQLFLTYLRLAIILSTCSLLILILYSHTCNIFSLIGHFLQIISFYFIQQALFISSFQMPYLQLFKSKERLEESFSLIGKALSSQLDIKENLQLIVNLAANMLQADYALIALGRQENTHLKVAAAKGFQQPPSLIPIENSIAGKAYKNNLSVWAKNIINNSPVFLPPSLNRKIYCIVATPIVNKNTVLGVLEVYFETKIHFSCQKSQLLSAFARHAGAALESSFLFQETRRQLREQQILYKLVTSLSSPLGLKETLRNCLLDAIQALEATKGSIFLLKENKDLLLEEIVAAENQDINIINLQDNKLLNSLLVKNQPSFFYNLTGIITNNSAWWVNIPVLLVLPLAIKNKTVGAFFLGWEEKERKFPSSFLNLAITIAQQLALGIEKNKLYKEIEKLALSDPLTGLANRRRFDFYLDHELTRTFSLQKPLCLVMLDLDKFKHYNDSYGHPTGDKVLIQVGEILRKSTYPIDLPARYGGEEFTIIMPDTNLQQGMQKAEKIREAIAQDYFPDNQRNKIVKLTASLGITCYQPSAIKQEIYTKERLIEEADLALYQAKNSGRNKVCVYNK